MKKTNYAYTVWQWGTENREQFVQSLEDITSVGYRYFESVKASINVFDGDPKPFLELCSSFGAKAVSFYFHMSGQWELDVDDALKKLPFLAECGIHRMTLQATGSKATGVPATKEELEYNLKAFKQIAEQAVTYDIIPCIHPHFNTAIMFESEIDYMMNNTDPEKVAFCPDTAHLVAGGCDPVKVIEKYKERVKFTHLKDIVGAGAETSGMQAGVEVYSNFRELGEGNVDFPAVFDILKSVGYEGYLTAELDRSRTTNKKSAEISMNYLKENY